MHIAIFIYGMTGGGAQRRILTLMKEFVRRGHRIDLITVSAGGTLASEVPPEVNCFVLKNKWIEFLPGNKFRKLKLFCSRKPLADYLRLKKPDVLLSAASHTSLTAIAARRLSGTGMPLVLRLSSHLTASHAGALNLFKRFRYRTAGRWFSEVDAVIAVADEIARDIAANTRLSSQRIKTIYNPTYTPDMTERLLESVDHPWFDEKGPRVILGAGRLTSRKDFQNLIRAFAVVRKQREVRLVILGEGGKRRELEGLAMDLGVSADVDMPGFVKNPLAWMSRASVFVLSSECEGLPGVLIEAMAAGCPIVSTNCPSGPAEILENGKYGRLVPVKDPQALAQAIIATLDSPRDEQLLRSRASDFSVSKAVDEYIDVLSRVVR